jgi:hypothetical protein
MNAWSIGLFGILVAAAIAASVVARRMVRNAIGRRRQRLLARRTSDQIEAAGLWSENLRDGTPERAARATRKRLHDA